ncbi:MAG: protoheme IX farnesyltransferase [Ignavibacteria bacterium]
MAGRIRMLLEIVKFKITILVSFTTGLGYLLGANEITLRMFYAIAGIFLLACSASALNHYQERETDALMKRTKHRPIPSGKIEASSVLWISSILFFSGSVVLFYMTNLEALTAGYLTFIWYNAVYTPLKRRTSWAIIPGSLVGALPPVAGWLAAGGHLFDMKIIVTALYFFIWQIPHFWLLLILYSEDYKRAGFPTLTNIFTPVQLKRITAMWLISTVLVALLIPLFGIINYGVSGVVLLTISLWMLYNSFRFLFSGGENKVVIGSFIRINFYTLMLITLLSIDKFISLMNQL